MAINNINDKVVLNLDDNEGLADYFSMKEPGEECTMTITGNLDEQTADQAVLSINKVSVEGYDSGKKKDDDELPVMMIMAGKAKKKAGDSY
tara:strand:- start:1020 stop:1292 length:273 start_codon:yes stop_codon:yes gene_type:complete